MKTSESGRRKWIWPSLVSDIVELSRKLRDALASVCDPVHPEDGRIRSVHHAIWCDEPSSPDADGRSVVFYGDKAIDRSPGGAP